MDLKDLERLLSQQRLNTYYKLFPASKAVAVEYYRLNMQISESLYPLLSNLEIILRNSIHSSFSRYFKSSNWFLQISDPDLTGHINIAKRKILSANYQVTPEKIIAELTFGFGPGYLISSMQNIFGSP